MKFEFFPTLKFEISILFELQIQRVEIYFYTLLYNYTIFYNF
jgi:hypothetical protein